MPTVQNSRIKNLSQERATFAFSEVKQAYNQLGENERKEFKSHIKDVPMMIRTNGLAAAYAFVFSKVKEGNDYALISAISQKWLVDHQKVFALQGNDNFYQQLCALDREPYRRAIRELLALFTWLKRFADGMIKSE